MPAPFRLLPAAALLLALAAPAWAGISPLWDKYISLYEANQPNHETTTFQGRVLGNWSERPSSLFNAVWPYRHNSYELLCADAATLARLIYGLALHAKDLDPSVDLARFERGAQGFHYGVDQITAWANDLLHGKFPLHSAQELALLGWLVEDGVLRAQDGALLPTGMAAHVLGAAPGKSRGLALNLDHERLHVLWDEDEAFRAERQAAWQALSDADKEAVYARLKGYDRTNQPQIIEEWAVYNAETTPPWK